jgi:hypothetical protein
MNAKIFKAVIKSITFLFFLEMTQNTDPKDIRRLFKNGGEATASKKIKYHLTKKGTLKNMHSEDKIFIKREVHHDKK